MPRGRRRGNCSVLHRGPQGYSWVAAKELRWKGFRSVGAAEMQCSHLRKPDLSALIGSAASINRDCAVHVSPLQ